MKKLSFSIAGLLFFALFNTCLSQANTEANKDSPYKIVYSSSFKMGNPAYAKSVLELWKDFDDNNFDRHNYLADTVVMMFPDGMVMKGKVANLDGVKKYRSSLSSVKSTVLAIFPVTSTDRHEDAVCIWGQEEDTAADGKVETKDIHEVWWFNTAGKVTMMRQWTAKFKEQ